MNKLFAKLTGVSLAFAMMISVGAAVVNNVAKGVYAADSTANYTLGSSNDIAASNSFPFNVKYTGEWNWNDPQCRTTDTTATVTFSGNNTVLSIKKIVIGCSSSGYAPAGTANNSYSTSTSSSSVSISGTGATSVTWTPGAAARLKTYKVTYVVNPNPSSSNSSSSSGSVTPVTYTVTYNANGGTGTMTDSNSPYNNESEVTVLSNDFTRTGYTFSHWNTNSNDTGKDYTPGDVLTITSNVNLHAQWNQELGDLTGETGTLSFGTSLFKLTADKKYGKDDLGVDWNVETVGTSSFTSQPTYMQIGSSSSPATSITIKTPALFDTYKVTSFSAKLGGFSGTAGTVTLKVGNTSVGTGSLNTDNDVIVSSTSIANASSLSVTITNIAKGVKIYYVSYTLTSAIETQTITASANSAFTDETITLETNANSANWAITANTANASLSTTNAKTTVVSATQAGSVTVQAAASGYTTVTKTLSFSVRPLGTYYTVSFDADGAINPPEEMSIEEGETFIFPSPGTKEHYSFLGWTSDADNFYDEGDESPAVTADIEYCAFWQEDAKYNVTYKATAYGHGSFTISDIYGGDYELLPFANLTGISSYTGYQFKNYKFQGNNKNPGDIVDLDDNVVIEVNFEKITADTLTVATAGINSTDYGDWSNKVGLSSGAVYAGNSSKSTNNSIQLRASNPSGIVSTKSGGKIDKIVVSWDTVKGTNQARTLDIYGSNTAYESAADLYDSNKRGTKIGTITYTNTTTYGTELTVSGDYSYVGIRSNGNTLYLNEVNFEWTTFREAAEALDTQTKLSYRYTKDGNNYTYTDMSIRFGGVISKSLWNALDTNSHLITGFGVMITTSNVVHAPYTIKDRASSAVLSTSSTDVTQNIVDYFMSKNDMATPVEQGDNYIWNLFYLIEFSEANVNEFYTVAPYVKIGNDFVFLKQVKYSVASLANDYINNRGYAEDAAEGSLKHLADLSPAE